MDTTTLIFILFGCCGFLSGIVTGLLVGFDIGRHRAARARHAWKNAALDRLGSFIHRA